MSMFFLVSQSSFSDQRCLLLRDVDFIMNVEVGKYISVDKLAGHWPSLSSEISKVLHSQTESKSPEEKNSEQNETETG